MRFLLLLCLILRLLAAPAWAEQPAQRVPGADWQSIDPAEAGWDIGALQQARMRVAQLHSTAVLVVQHGAIVAAWGDTAEHVELASVRKSLLSALIGIAVAQKRINLDATLGSLGIDDNPPSLSIEEKQATVRELLEARSGVYHAALYETADMAAQRPPRGSHPPGSFWYYNNWDFNALGTIYEHAVGTSIFDAFARDIATPIGMQDYRPSDGRYVRGPGSIHPAYPFHMSARDLARFALLYLHDGRWGDRQVVPADWVRASAQSYSDSRYGIGYGYLWWTALHDASPAPGVRLPPGTYFAAGYGGEFAYVMPARDLVVVHLIARDAGHFVTGRQMGELLGLILTAARDAK